MYEPHFLAVVNRCNLNKNTKVIFTPNMFLKDSEYVVMLKVKI